jgi:hypothetical protein
MHYNFEAEAILIAKLIDRHFVFTLKGGIAILLFIHRFNCAALGALLPLLFYHQGSLNRSGSFSPLDDFNIEKIIKYLPLNYFTMIIVEKYQYGNSL